MCSFTYFGLNGYILGSTVDKSLFTVDKLLFTVDKLPFTVDKRTVTVDSAFQKGSEQRLIPCVIDYTNNVNQKLPPHRVNSSLFHKKTTKNCFI